MTTHYDVYLLDGKDGVATGINNHGLIVGNYSDDAGNPQIGSWSPNFTSGLIPEFQLSAKGPVAPPGMTEQWVLASKVDDTGDAILPTGELFNFPLDLMTEPLPFTDATALNSNHLVVGGPGIFNWAKPQQQPFPIPSPTGQTVTASAINNLGDVVGTMSGGHAFAYPATHPAQVVDLASSFILDDINDNQIAVGRALDSGVGIPQYYRLPNVTPQTLPLPPDIAGTILPLSINRGGTIVGNVGAQFPFVFQPGEITAVDLNSLWLNKPSGCSIQIAKDINDAGNIVGVASTREGQAAFIAIPRATLDKSLTGLIFDILHGLLRVLQGIGMPAMAPISWDQVPLEQREMWLSFAISNMASLPEPPLSKAQKEQIAKIGNRMRQK